jgi:SAM-dependent methyltransferase
VSEMEVLAGTEVARGKEKVSGSKFIDEQDRERSMTAHMLPDLERALALLKEKGLASLLDIGCGFGGVAAFSAAALGIRDVHGVDRDARAVKGAKGKGVQARCAVLGSEPLPYEDGRFDLVTSFGMLDYLPDFDPAIEEIVRLIKPGGYVLISLPNLASWHNRLALLLGYQPRDVEISQRYLVGVHPHYSRRGERPVGHIHVPTTRAFRELMEAHGLETVKILPGLPANHRRSPLIVWIDRSFTAFPGFARRFVYLGCKQAQVKAANE